MRDQASRTEPFPRAAGVLQAGISDRGPCSHASHELPSKTPQVSPCHESRRGSASREVLVTHFKLGGLTRRGSPCPDLSAMEKCHGAKSCPTWALLRGISWGKSILER